MIEGCIDYVLNLGLCSFRLYIASSQAFYLLTFTSFVIRFISTLTKDYGVNWFLESVYTNTTLSNALSLYNGSTSALYSFLDESYSSDSRYVDFNFIAVVYGVTADGEDALLPAS